MSVKNFDLSYLITVSKAHFQPALFLLKTLKPKTDKDIIIVGNLENEQIELIESYGVKYVNENEIDSYT